MTHPHILLGRLDQALKQFEECRNSWCNLSTEQRDHLKQIREAFDKLNERLKASDAVNRELARREA